MQCQVAATEWQPQPGHGTHCSQHFCAGDPPLPTSAQRSLKRQVTWQLSSVLAYSPSPYSSFPAGISLGAHEHQSHPATCYPKPPCLHFSFLPSSHCPSPPASFLTANSSFSGIYFFLRVSRTDLSHLKANAFSAAWGLPTPLCEGRGPSMWFTKLWVTTGFKTLTGSEG